jgi:ATP-binding cassette, subfamily B, bacterial CvaB/MchF/RaxB
MTRAKKSLHTLKRNNDSQRGDVDRVQHKMKLYLQTEPAECSLACLAMVADHYGLRMDMPALRQRFSLSLKGATLEQLIRYAQQLGFASRPLRLELEELGQLRTPCILHWDLNHFVVLKKVERKLFSGPSTDSGRTGGGNAEYRRTIVTILDPAAGERRMTLGELSDHFTGVALELTPTAQFKPADECRRVRLRDLTGVVFGLKPALLRIFLLALCLEVMALLTPMTTQWVVDEALVSGDKDLLLLIVLGAGFLALADFAVRTARGWMAMRLSMDVGLQWTTNTFTHLTKLPVSYFEKRHLGDITSRFGSLTSIKNTLTSGAIAAVLDGIMLVATLILMFLYSAKLTAVVLLAIGIYALIRWASYRPFRQATEERIQLAAKESSYFLETIRAIAPLKLFGREAERLARWQNLAVDVQNRDVKTQQMGLWFASANTLIFGLEAAVLLLIGGWAVLERQMSIGMLMAFMAYKTQFAGRATALINLAIEVKMLSLHAERLADVVLEKPEAPVLVETDLARITPAIELKNVSFRYGEGEPWVLKDLNLQIAAGDHVALVGPSGCGKTTLLKILLGLHVPQEGEVRVGGIPITQLGLAQYRRLVGTVMQDDALLAGSMLENITFFDVKPEYERAQMAAQIAQVHQDIVAMPMGYQTLVGEMGSTLSGGQKQRVLLARALYKAPKILALDEATSHLDVENEKRVNAALANLQLTRLIVAHRPETIASAKRVIELQGGRVVRELKLTQERTQEAAVHSTQLMPALS